MFLKESSVMMQVRELLESLLIFHLFGLLLGHCSFYEDPEQPEGKCSHTHTHKVSNGKPMDEQTLVKTQTKAHKLNLS